MGQNYLDGKYRRKFVKSLLEKRTFLNGLLIKSNPFLNTPMKKRNQNYMVEDTDKEAKEH
ncbi:MAG: hypothetical protein LBE12_08705 [Planctomycetaceae bacterium]|nr:hypothetical protein [Planctomycetaceae bacterium]